MSVLGVDEVGRGPLAGPLLVGAVVFRPETLQDNAWLATLKDSKKLTKTARTRLSSEIRERAFVGLGQVSAAELDQIGISASLKLAAIRAITELQRQKVTFTHIVIDGNLNFLASTEFSPLVTTVVKADDVIKEVSAASIIAKVARDNQMADYALKYPGYGFEKHSGYGTAAHLVALRTLGPSPIHRRSFRPVSELILSTGNHGASSNIVKNTTQTLRNPSHVVKNTTPSVTASSLSPVPPIPSTKSLGDAAESIAAAHLQSLGHTILVRNFRRPSFEIDIISVDQNHIYFTEVRYRRSADSGGAMLSITPAKLAKMRSAATKFLASVSGQRLIIGLVPAFTEFSPLLAIATLSGPDSHPKLDAWFPLV